MNKILNDFWKDTAMRDAVHDYLVSYLKEQALDRLFNGAEDSSVYGFPEAKQVIDGAFINLDDLFEPKPKVSGTNSPR